MTATSADFRAIGRSLAEARRTGRAAEIDLSALGPGDAELAQAEANVAYGGTRIGYKIGCTSAEAQAIVGADGPFFGPMVATDAYKDGAIVRWGDQFRGVECEFAFRFETAWPAPGAPPDRNSLLSAIATCHPALEIVARRTPGAGLPKAPGIVADFAAHGAFVEGPTAGWRDVDLAAVAVAGLFNGAVCNRGSGAAVLGHPLNALMWLGEDLAARGRQIEAGEIVTTGTALGVVRAAPGAAITGDFGTFGRVSLRFSDE